jgi:8-oxo-dGTP diphosphatase
MMGVKAGVGVFIFKSGKFLMQKRKGAHGKDTWSVPGGWMEFSESFEDTAKREVMEEVGLKIKNVRVAGVNNSYFKEEGVHSVTIWVMSDYMSGTAIIQEPDRIQDLLWCDFSSLPNPLFQPWNNLLKSDFIGKIKNQLK